MERIELVVDDEDVGLRLDRCLAKKTAAISRSEIQRAIRAGHVTIGGVPTRQPSRRLRQGEKIVFEIAIQPLLSPARMALEILYEDEQIVVVNKPVGLVVHPGAGQSGTTLVEGLLADRDLPIGDDPARPGIVHRLDKKTSGVIVVAKTLHALECLKQQFAEHRVSKFYLTVVEGEIAEEEGLIDAPIGRDPASPTRMTIHPQGRAALSEFCVLARNTATTLLLVSPRTGRTHQIRVHLYYIGHPIVGDPLFGREGERLMLHAWRIALTHPTEAKVVRFEAPVPPEFPQYPYREIAWPEWRSASSPVKPDSRCRSPRRETPLDRDEPGEEGGATRKPWRRK